MEVCTRIHPPREGRNGIVKPPEESGRLFHSFMERCGFMKEPGTDGGSGLTAREEGRQPFRFSAFGGGGFPGPCRGLSPDQAPRMVGAPFLFNLSLFMKMKEGPFRRRPTIFPPLRHRDDRPFRRPSLYHCRRRPCGKASVSTDSSSSAAAMESTGEGALATLLPEWLVEHIRPWMVRYRRSGGGFGRRRPGAP